MKDEIFEQILTVLVDSRESYENELRELHNGQFGSYSDYSDHEVERLVEDFRVKLDNVVALIREVKGELVK